MIQQQNISDTTVHTGGSNLSPMALVSGNALFFPPCELIPNLIQRYWKQIKSSTYSPYFLTKKEENISMITKIRELEAISKKQKLNV